MVSYVTSLYLLGYGQYLIAGLCNSIERQISPHWQGHAVRQYTDQLELFTVPTVATEHLLNSKPQLLVVQPSNCKWGNF